MTKNNLIWDHSSKMLIQCQDMKLDININPNPGFFKKYSELCQLEFSLDYSYLNWIQEWLKSGETLGRKKPFKRDIHSNMDILFLGCFPKLVNLNSQNNKIELIIVCDYYDNLPFNGIREIQRDLAINEILYN